MPLAGYSCADSALRAARAGCPGAWGALLYRYIPYLLLLTRGQVGPLLQSKVDAEDIVQDTMTQAHKKRGQFAGTTEHELLGWLRSILASRIAKIRRRYLGTQQRDVRLELSLAGYLERSSIMLAAGLASSSLSPSGQAVRHENAIRLAEALESLPAHYREVIVLHHVERLEFTEVAREMGRTLNSVKHLWARALAQLQASLQREL